MNIRVVGNYLGRILALDGACMIPPLFIALFKGERSSFYAFLTVIAAQLIFAALLIMIKIKDKNIYAREGFVIVAVSWILISAFGALPMYISGAIPSYLNALFETISGFTTTGATILTEIETLPMSILYWRSFTHWLGGMGVLVLVLALAPSNHGSGMPLHILRAESPGPNVGKLAPKLHFTARILYAIYIVLTLLEILLLLLGGMPFFDALTTSFGTAGTGGFAIKNDSLASYSMYCQGVVSVFMLMFGVNFNIYFLMLMGDIRGVVKNTELKVYLSIIAVSTVAISLCLTARGVISNLGVSFHHSLFQVASIITTTGFSTVDFNLWPEFTHEIMLILMVIGACAGSTGGGLKVSRVIILCKSMRAEVKRLIHPHSVTAVTLDGKPLEKGTAERCSAFFFVYVFIIAVSVLLISFEGCGFKTNFSAVIACLNNIGPGMETVGPMDNYSFFSPVSKLVLMFDMLLGRLEIFPLLLTFMPATWLSRKYG